VQPAEDKLDGPLVTPPGGSLRLRIARATGAEAAEPTVWVRPLQLNHARKLELGRREELLVENLSPGDYRIAAYARGLAPAECAASVVAGATAEATLQLAPATLREFVVDYPADQPAVRLELK
jgi:hypothetical protein